MRENFTGMNVVNANGSELRMNFICSGNNFSEITKDYNQRIEEYIEKVSNQNTTIKDVPKLR